MPTLEFWFDFASTYSYLAASRIEAAAAERRVDVAYRPFLLGPLFAARGLTTSPFNVDAEKGRYMWRDVERAASDLGLPFRRPSTFPRRSTLAARLAIVGVEQGWGAPFCRAVFAESFAEDRNIADPAVLDALLARLGVDGPAVRALAESPDEKPKLRRQTERAAELGLFGAPSFLVEGELFWGNDRLEQALDWARRRAGERERTATSEHDVTPWIERLKALFEGRAAPPIARLIGFRLVAIDEGRAIFEMTADPSRHANPMGTVHGGVLVDLADAAMGFAMASTLGAGESFTTVELKANYFKPVWSSHLRAEARMVKRSHSLGYLECDVTDESGSLVCRTGSTCTVLRGDAAAGRSVPARREEVKQ